MTCALCGKELERDPVLHRPVPCDCRTRKAVVEVRKHYEDILSKTQKELKVVKSELHEKSIELHRYQARYGRLIPEETL